MINSLDDLIKPSSSVILNLDEMCLSYIILVSKETYDSFKTKSDIIDILSDSVIENTLHGYGGISNYDFYEVYYKNESKTIQSEYYSSVSNNYNIDFDWSINESLTDKFENDGFYLQISFNMQIRDSDKRNLINNLK